MARLLTDADAAHARGMTLTEFHESLDRGEVPAPTRFVRDPLTGQYTGYWAEGDTPAARSLDVRNRAQRLHLLLDELRWYLLRNGHFSMAQSTEGRITANGQPYRLGVRLGGLRAAHRTGHLSAEEAAMFEALPGWEWDHRDAAWRARFDAVVHAWPNLDEAQRVWLANQRRRYQKLRPAARAMLDARPDLAQPGTNSRADQFCAAARVWLKENPDRTMFACGYNETVEIDGQEYPVGRKVIYYRRRWSGQEGVLPLSPTDIAKIERLPGWTWESSPQHVIAATKRDDLQYLPHIRLARQEYEASSADNGITA